MHKQTTGCDRSHTARGGGASLLVVSSGHEAEGVRVDCNPWSGGASSQARISEGCRLSAAC